ncbi:tetratricopeptide repeat protein [Nostoc sp. CCY 9925]|uniref:tetratricopeptide repeat protein n=1 Tax=Nostoc sp. CCY 9925 TaxID=3103865 RepID=UPI0039C70461
MILIKSAFLCFSLDKEVRQQLRTQRILKIADGIPRLLKWLLEVIQQPGLAVDELLNRLEATEQKFREDILAKTLLDALDVDEQKFLARLSVFNLPVTEEILQAISSADEFTVLGKLTSLSLVESATIHPNQPTNYRVTKILEPLLEPVLTAEEWQATRQQAVKKIHQVWWEETGKCTEAELLEILHLALLAKEEEIAVKIGYRIANTWINNSRFVEALELCEQVLAVYQDYRILGTVARAEEVLGLVQEAVTHYQQALELCPENDEIFKSTSLNNMALAIYQQGNLERALYLWQQSLAIDECIGNFNGKATSLSNMADAIATQGDIERAFSLWHQSLEIVEYIGDFQGKAVILCSMASLIVQKGDVKQALSLWQQSLEIFEHIGDIRGKAQTLHNIAKVIHIQGDIEQALSLWQQSLEIKQSIGDIQGQAATLSNIAWALAKQGNIETAMQLWQQDFNISERIGDIKGKAATLSNMAWVSLQEGNIEQALSFWQQTLELDECIGDVKSKATTLANMAYVAWQIGDTAQQLDLNLQAAQSLVRVHAYGDLLTVLNNLGVADESNGLVYLAQAIWLSLKIEAPVTDTIQFIVNLYQTISQTDELQALLVSVAACLCKQIDKDHPQLAEFQNLIDWMISVVANINKIETPQEFASWFVQQKLNDPEYFLPLLNQRLEEIVGDRWLFDRSQIVRE